VTAHNAGAGATPVIIGLIVIVLLVLRRTSGQPLRGGKLLVLPVIVLAAGFFAAQPAVHDVHLRSVDELMIGLDLVLSIGLGSVRGLSVQIYQREGVTWYRYGTVTVLLWATSIGLRFLIGFLGARHGATELAASGSVLFMLGLSLLTQNLVIAGRARRPARPAYGRADPRSLADRQ
jgi:hypothetical protein